MYNQRVLLLNATFEPIRVIGAKRAIALVVQETADVIENSEEIIRSERAEMFIPSVIRLKEFVKIPYRARVPLNRRTLLMRDGHECQFTHCNRRGTTIDHVHPRSKGGTHSWDNVVAACQKCNAKKADKLMSDLGWKLKKPPVQPNWNLWLVSGLRERPEWEPYLAHFNMA